MIDFSYIVKIYKVSNIYLTSWSTSFAKMGSFYTEKSTPPAPWGVGSAVVGRNSPVLCAGGVLFPV
jgi:hypothetical protein